MKQPHTKSSWQNVSGWYNDTVKEEGHYYHQHIILPGVKRLLPLKKGDLLLDLACGQGVLERQVPAEVEYLGIDISPALIKAAAKLSQNPLHKFKVADVAKPIALEKPFSYVTIILALQNIAKPLVVLKNAAQALASGGKLMIVLNHPCYRIPRQSSWKIDEHQKVQFRRVDRYMSSMEIPIQMNPGKGLHSEETFSYHYPLSGYMQMLQESGFVVETLEEWCSNKESSGKAAKMENRARAEFPLFLTLLCRKI